MTKILIKRLSKKVSLPKYETSGSSGMDLAANVDAKIMFGVAKGCTPLDIATWINNPNRKNEIINVN